MFNSKDEPGLVKVLEFLKAHNTEYLSGQDLSDVLKISRVAIWKHVKKIKELGYVIKSDQSLGYKLESNTNKLLPWEITDKLDTKSIGKYVYYFDSINSTQKYAKKIKAEHGTLIIADKQTEGMGRDGRIWISPKGGISLSIILHPKFDISTITIFPLAVSLALSIAIKKTLSIQTELKWPNDLMINGKKIAGILVDASLESNIVESLIVGVGINFNINVKDTQKMLKDTNYDISSLVQDKKIMPKILVQAFLKELELIYSNIHNRTKIIRDWTTLSSTIGRKVEVSTTDEKIRGTATKIDDDGALVISDGSTNKRVIAGNVIHL